MTTLGATSIVSAAVISGDLILGLSTGEIINCGRVQGPQGLKGDKGAMGDVGRPGIDGNTIHTVAGVPDITLGKDGDYAIDSRLWEIYGPRTTGQWGTGTPLRGNKRGDALDDKKRNLFGNNPQSDRPAKSGSTTYGPVFPNQPGKGDQHVMDNTLYEYVYTGGAWMQIDSPAGGGGGSGGGATTLGALLDVTLTNTQEGEVLAATNSGTWENSQNVEGGSF